MHDLREALLRRRRGSEGQHEAHEEDGGKENHLERERHRQCPRAPRDLQRRDDPEAQQRRAVALKRRAGRRARVNVAALGASAVEVVGKGVVAAIGQADPHRKRVGLVHDDCRVVHPLAAEVAFGALEVEAVINQDEDQNNDLQEEEDRRVISGLLHVQVLLVGVSFVQYFEDLLLLRSIERLEVPLYPRFAHIISLQ